MIKTTNNLLIKIHRYVQNIYQPCKFLLEFEWNNQSWQYFLGVTLTKSGLAKFCRKCLLTHKHFEKELLSKFNVLALFYHFLSTFPCYHLIIPQTLATNFCNPKSCLFTSAVLLHNNVYYLSKNVNVYPDPFFFKCTVNTDKTTIYLSNDDTQYICYCIQMTEYYSFCITVFLEKHVWMELSACGLFF